ncbi:S1C family serine protease [Pseudonocardia cypriaca]|uniref:Putative serine protease PepD n=1 Tax=Pseudonocardia cypriaca TaxID=882449 RepID=A0A543FYK5_9PSEU|nr:trypsin-like peptidase domain-containing protein [Pseudonocardia cypriaca]TQM38926.1 putative serine protease PepD [Pseudonocardia cypriaca]
MANHPSDHDAVAGGPDDGAQRSPGEQAHHAAQPGWGAQGRAPYGGGPPAAATAEIPTPAGWPGRASGLPEHGATTAWSGGWPTYGAPAAPPVQGSWYGPRPTEPQAPAHPYHPPQIPPYGPPPGSYYPEPRSRTGSSRRGTLIALTLVAMLLSGVIGGVVGHSLAGSGRGGSIGVLGLPLPSIDTASAPTTPVEAVAARVLPSVVQLRVDGPTASGEGSAMVLSADGLLLTNNHVVEQAAESGTVTAVFQDGATATAAIVGRDPSSDLAVIRAQNMTGLVPVELGNSDSLRVGQQVVAFGAPLGLGGTVTTGIISAVDRAVNVGEETGANTPTVLNALQTDAAINPGNSGGPLVDMDGRVVGINSAIATTGAQGGSIGVGFSIPINQARRVAEELERTGRASRAVLGVTVIDDPRQAGAVIKGVTPGGAAEQAGIREGDIVLRFGDQRISTGTDLQAAVGSRAPGEVIEVQLADRTVQATLTAAPN